MPILPDDFPFEEGRKSVLGIPVVSMTEYQAIGVGDSSRREI